MAVSAKFRVAYMRAATPHHLAHITLFRATDNVAESGPLPTLHWGAQLTLEHRSLVVTPLGRIDLSIADPAVMEQLRVGQAVQVVFA